MVGLLGRGEVGSVLLGCWGEVRLAVCCWVAGENRGWQCAVGLLGRGEVGSVLLGV